MKFYKCEEVWRSFIFVRFKPPAFLGFWRTLTGIVDFLFAFLLQLLSLSDGKNQKQFSISPSLQFGRWRRCNSFWGRIACSWYRRISHQYDSIFIVSSLPRYKNQHCWGRHKDEQTTHSTFGSGETHFFSARCIFHKVVRVYTHFYYLPCVLCSLGTSWGYPITSENSKWPLSGKLFQIGNKFVSLLLDSTLCCEILE